MQMQADRSAGKPPSQGASLQGRRAEPPRPPSPPPVVVKAQKERATYLRQRETVEHRSILRGLLLLALAVLLFSVARAGIGRAFVTGWWRHW